MLTSVEPRQPLLRVMLAIHEADTVGVESLNGFVQISCKLRPRWKHSWLGTISVSVKGKQWQQCGDSAPACQCPCSVQAIASSPFWRRWRADACKAARAEGAGRGAHRGSCHAAGCLGTVVSHQNCCFQSHQI